jgi:vitamin B12 transporter
VKESLEIFGVKNKSIYINYRQLLIYTILFLTNIFVGKICAQDTIFLQPVNILDSKIDLYTNHINVQKSDSFMAANFQSKNLAEILENTSGTYIRSYGLGGITMLSMRNGNSYQSAVLWNGFNLQDPLNGGINLSLLPGFFIDNIEMHRGGETSLFGAGAMGGSVFLNSNTEFNKGFQMQILSSMGSFESYQGGLGLGFSSKQWSTKIKFFHRQAENNFPFINFSAIGNPVDFQKSAAFNQQGILQQNTVSIKNNQKINLDFWILRSDNQVPTTMAQSAANNGSTLTKNLRSTTLYTLYRNSYTFKFRSALIYNSLLFNDINTNLNYIHQSLSQITEAEAEIKITKKHQMLFGLNNTFDNGFSESLSPKANRNRSSIFLSWNWLATKKFALITNFRKEVSALQKIPFTYSFRANYKLIKVLTVYISHSKNYRLPTFNDLFWSDNFSRGNPYLKPEFGNNQELGFTYNKDFRKINLSIKLNYFNSNMNDLIQWMPSEGIWTPENFDQVKSNGIESSLLIDLSFSKKTKLRFNTEYSYLNSIITRTALDYSEEILGNQMMFVPKHKGSLNARIILGNYFAEYYQNATGKVYTTIDNSEFLKGYTIGNISGGRNFKLKNSIITLSLKIENIFNSDWQVMPGYAMPGRHFEICLQQKL